jgi:hypothetical protein
MPIVSAANGLAPTALNEFPDLDERIEELRRYIAVLREEEILTEFVEQQVCMVLGKARLRQALDGDLTEEPLL